MEVSSSSSLMFSNYWWVIVWIIVVVLLFRAVVVALWWKPRKMESDLAKQGIRGPSYKFLVGNVKEIVELMIKASAQPMPNLSHNIVPRVFSFYHHWKKIYGATFVVWFGPTPRLTVSEPDLIREIFTTNSNHYEKIEANPLIKKLEGNGLISLKAGHKWTHHRRIISQTFHSENLNLLIPVIIQSFKHMVDNWHSTTDDDEVAEVEVAEWFQRLTEEVITRVTFGMDEYEAGCEIFKLQNRQMVLAAGSFQKMIIPGYRYLPTPSNLKSWRLDKEIRRSLAELIQRRKEKFLSSSSFSECDDSNNQRQHHKDLLGLMIRSAPETFTVDDIVEECKGFFFAGKQTTANLLTWTTVLLAMHPYWQHLARQEVLNVCGGSQTSSRPPTKEDLIKLRTLTMILNESLRLYPPVIATIRRTKQSTKLGHNFHLPHGTELLIPVLAIHHDSEMWGDDVNDFNPGRFSDGAARAARHPAAFLPFGLGLRRCVGQNLALLEVKLIMALLLRRYEFRLGEKYRHAPTVLMLLYPQYGAQVVFNKRSC